jgi:hypothetical protein
MASASTITRPVPTSVSTGSGGSSRWRRVAPWTLAVGSFVLFAMVANLPAWLHGPNHLMQIGGAGDIDQEVWFLGFTPEAIIHGLNPFVTNWINFPSGTNLMVNTAMFVPGLLLAPITLTLGPVVSFNVLVVLGMAGSATAAFAVFQRWAPWKPAAYAGALLYGFSPYMFGAGFGHLFLLCVALPPLFLLVLDEILVRDRRSAPLLGVLLGLMASVQLLTSSEVLASSVLMSAVGVVVLAAARPGQVLARLRRAVVSLATAGLTFVVVCGYPLWVLLFGRGHITGPAQPVSALAPLRTDLLGLIVPTWDQAISPAPLQHVGNQFVGQSLGENGSYLGVTLVLVLVVLVVRFWRIGVVRFAAAMSAVALILSFGSRLNVDGHDTGVRLPFSILTHLPLVDSSVAVRYSLYVFLFAGLLLAVGLDRLHRSTASSRAVRRRSAVLCGLLAVVSLVPLVPHWPYAIWSTAVPTFFRSPAVDQIPPGSVALTYPFPRGPEHNEAMLWQVQNDLRFRLPGGYVITAGAGGVATFDGGATFTEGLLEDAYTGAPLPSLTDRVAQQVRHDLETWDADTVVVASRGTNPGEAVDLFRAVLGASPKTEAHAKVWFHVIALLHRPR